MGCFWSCEGSVRCQDCNKKAANNLIIIDGKCQFCRQRAEYTRKLQDLVRCRRCYKEATKNLLINGECQICRQRATLYESNKRATPQPRESSPLRPLFGQYRCSCGRKWASRRSWRGYYQICKRCKKHVYPHTQRELRPGDMSHDRENTQDHPKELCQRCTELGYYCGK